jgi:DNA polymerase-1
MSREQVEYACMDANVTLQVWNEQRKYIKQNDMYIWRQVDQPALWALMEFEGFTIDVDKWLALAEKNRQRADEIDANLPINPRSPKQVLAFLRQKGFKRLKNTQEDTLQEAIDKYPDTDAVELAMKILDSRKYAKRASTYGQTFLEQHGEQRSDGSTFIHCDYWVTGASTGRTSSDKPNMQNQINDFDFRDCYIARPGNVLVDCDYSQQEIGIAAYISEDKKMREIFNSGQDIYIRMAKEMYGKDITKADPLRKRMKAVVLGTDYGMSKYGLAKKERMELDEAEDVIKRFRKNFPGMDNWMNKQSVTKTCTYTILGRRAWLNPYSSQCPRNALNNPIQGSAGDQLKQAIARVTDEIVPGVRKFGDGGIVAIPHDEIIMDVPKDFAEDVAKMMSTIMVDVANRMCNGQMKFRAEPTICSSWAGKG